MANEKKETLQYWEERARKVNDINAVTHADSFQRELEIHAISRFLEKKDKVLDVGCGNGYGTAFFSEVCGSISGVDFSPTMIERARKENAKGGKISYEVSDIRIKKPAEKYDKIITVRCLINILDWEDQKRAISNIGEALVSGGTFLMMEGVADGRAKLNEFRVKLGLSQLPLVAYNLDFERARTEEFLGEKFEIQQFLTFGNYEWVTRLIYPMYIAPEEPVYGSKFNEIALKICETIPDHFPEISKLGMWVLKKK